MVKQEREKLRYFRHPANILASKRYSHKFIGIFRVLSNIYDVVFLWTLLKKWSFPLRLSSVNVSKSARYCGDTAAKDSSKKVPSCMSGRVLNTLLKTVIHRVSEILKLLSAYSLQLWHTQYVLVCRRFTGLTN